MQLESLILHLQEKLREHRVNAQKPNACDLLQRETYYLNLEADYTFRKLEAVINQLKGNPATYNGKVEITPDHVKIITDFFSQRWDLIKSTDAIYSVSVLSSANMLCRELANYLSKQLRKLVNDKNENALLMPTIKVWRNPGHDSSDMSVISPHRFLPTDDNLYCIEILHSVASNVGGSLVLKQREHGTEQGKEKSRCLTARLSERDPEIYEFERVINHSQLVTDHYTKITPMLRNPEANKKSIDAMTIHLRDALMKDDYVKNSGTIRATYGFRGDDLLKTNLLSKINDGLFADREQLFDYMAGKLMFSEWEDFLKKIDPRVLTTLICQKDTVKNAVTSKAMQNNHYQHDLAVICCQSVVYEIDRAPKGRFTSLFGGEPIELKLMAVRALRAGIVENKLGDDVDNYIKSLGDASNAAKYRTVGYMFANLKEVVDKHNQAVSKKSAKMMG